jgi:poly-gamma-glutamate synthesis protein (capsule biosynthesis protein)
MIVTGDVIPARSVNYKSTQYNNFKWAFEPTAKFLRSSDITYVNLEAPIINDCPVTNEGMIFCGSALHSHGLAYAGVDIVNLANNHLGNHGKEGIEETTQILDQQNIQYSGIENNPQYREIKGNKIAFLGYDDIELQPGVSSADENIIVSEITEADKNADYVIVQFHWGVEYVTQPNERQKTLARLAVDSGADLIIGNHPHWIQPVEIYKNSLITYAHGNFIFDQMWSEKTKEGVIGKYYFYKSSLIDVEYIPIKIFDYGQAQFVNDEYEYSRIIDSMYQESILLQKSSLHF